MPALSSCNPAFQAQTMLGWHTLLFQSQHCIHTSAFKAQLCSAKSQTLLFHSHHCIPITLAFKARLCSVNSHTHTNSLSPITAFITRPSKPSSVLLIKSQTLLCHSHHCIPITLLSKPGSVQLSHTHYSFSVPALHS